MEELDKEINTMTDRQKALLFHYMHGYFHFEVKENPDHIIERIQQIKETEEGK